MTEEQSKDKPHQSQKLDPFDAHRTALQLGELARHASQQADTHRGKAAWEHAVKDARYSMLLSAQAIYVLALHERPDTTGLTLDQIIQCLKALLAWLPESDSFLFTVCAQALLWAYAWPFGFRINQLGIAELLDRGDEPFGQKDAELAGEYVRFCLRTLTRLENEIGQRRLPELSK